MRQGILIVYPELVIFWHAWHLQTRALLRIAPFLVFHLEEGGKNFAESLHIESPSFCLAGL